MIPSIQRSERLSPKQNDGLRLNQQNRSLLTGRSNSHLLHFFIIRLHLFTKRNQILLKGHLQANLQTQELLSQRYLTIKAIFDIISIRTSKMRVEIALIIIISLASVAQSTTQVDNLNLLLPQLTDSSRALPLQLITAQGGCYNWASSATSVLSITPHDNKSGPCSKQALVQVAKAGHYSSSIYVTATDAATESILNIPVRIRKLSKIMIATKSRMMNLKEIQKIELFAHDSEENTFTSLEGLRFSWRLEKAQIIEPVSLANAQLYLPLRTRENLEKEGFQSDILVVRALSPGNLKIYVKCIEPGYENLTDEITLSVHERFELKPGPILRMVPSSGFQLYLERPSSEIILLPQTYYNIKSCAGFSVNSSLFLTVSEFPSKCEIRVEDTRTVPPYSSSVTVIVENPTELKIASDSIIIVGQKLPYQVRLFNSANEQLFGQSKNIKIESDFQIDVRNNFIQAKYKKVGWIRATLNNLRALKDITSLLPIRALLPSDQLHLPLDETFKLRLVGGSGIYDYSVSNEIAVISSLGVVLCNEVGEAKITVVDRSYPANRAVIDLKVSTIASIKSLQQYKEVNRDEWGSFYIIGRSADQQTFTQCLNSQYTLSLPSHKLEIDKKVNFSESIQLITGQKSKLVQQAIEPTSLLKGKAEDIISSFRIYVESKEIQKIDLKIYINSLENYGICEIIRFRSLVQLDDRAVIELAGSENHAEVKVPLRVYEPITTIIKDDNNYFLLTPLSSLIWSYQGGSYSWPNSETKVTVNNALTTQNTKPQIVCPNYERASVAHELKLENAQTKFLLFPASQRSQINVACKFPKKLSLLLEKGDFYDELLVHPNSEVAGTVEPLDELGNQFYNSSNILYNFEANTGAIEGKGTTFSYKSKKSSDKVRIYSEKLTPGLNFKKVQTEFGVSVVQPIKVDHLLFDPSVEAAPSDNLRREIQIITLFTPKKPYIFTLTNASPLLQIRCNESVTCQKQENKLLVNLLNIGRGFVSLKDKRVYGSIEWIYEFVIVEVDEVTIKGDRDNIPQGESVNLYIYNLYNGNIISPLLYEDNYLQLGLDRSLKIVEQSGNRFLVTANVAGKYEIHGEQGYPKTIRSKNPFILNVYQRIQPDIINSISRKQANISVVQGESTVVIGCKRILRIKGGPSDMEVSFTNEKNLVVNAQSSNTFSIVGENQGKFSLSFQVKHNALTIAVIKLLIVVSKVQSLELTSIDEPVIGAQFRILPRFKVGESQVEGCVCDFDYKWSTSKKIISLGYSLSLGFLAGGGINATALKEGNEIISLEVKDKLSNKVIGEAQRYIKVVKEMNLLLPHVIRTPYEQTETLRISPLTSYSFGRQYTIQSKEDLIKINSQENSIEASKKLGHNTIKLSREGYLSEYVEVEVTYIAGIFIANDQGYLPLNSNSVQEFSIYLYDNHGKLFSTPLNNLEIYATSSNPDVLRVALHENQKKITVSGLNAGTSVLTISLAGRNVYDTIAVSVGNLIIPSSQVRVLKQGIVKFSLPQQSSQKWKSSDPHIASINERTGQAKALALGKCKISNGNVFGTIIVTRVTRVEQVNYTQLNQGEYKIVYKALWQGRNGEQELPSFLKTEYLHNNFKPFCDIKDIKEKSWFGVKSQIIQQQGHQRLACTIKITANAFSTDLPERFTITVSDSSDSMFGIFHYPSYNGFILDRNNKQINLSSKQPRDKLNIKTPNVLNIIASESSRRWLKSYFDQDKKIQTVSIDMSGQTANISEEIEVSNGQQREKISIIFSKTSETPVDNHSFISFSMDWPDYVIVIMGLTFGTLCILQYYSEAKIKNE